MSYSTTFFGRFMLAPPLSSEHYAILKDLADEEHTPGEDGKPLREDDSGYPCRYCQWRPSEDGSGIEWDLGEKFYCWLEWLTYIVQRYLKTWGYQLNGKVHWRGTEPEDSGVIYVMDNQIEAVRDKNPGPSWARASTAAGEFFAK